MSRSHKPYSIILLNSKSSRVHSMKLGTFDIFALSMAIYWMFCCRFDASSKLFISFKEHHFISLNRSEAYTIADTIASCGGLLGLFMGVSVLSVIELLYYFTLRLCCKMRQHNAIGERTASSNSWARHTLNRQQLEKRTI